MTTVKVSKVRNHGQSGASFKGKGGRVPERLGQDSEELSEDQETIFEETAHMANRDDMALKGHTIVSGGSTADTDDSWSYERKDRLLGDSDYSSESVDTQLEAVGQITEEIHDPVTHHDPTPAIPLDLRNEFDRFSDEDLLRMADVLGIPDRTNMVRPKLIERIRNYEGGR